MKTPLFVGLTVLVGSSLALAQPTARPAAARPTFESALPAGATVVARWDLPTDASNNVQVLAQTVRNQTEFACVAGALVNGTWQLQTAPKEPGDDDPASCLSAARVNNRWVVGRWTLGGSGDGRNRTNDSELEVFSLVGGRYQSVWRGAVTGFGRLLGGAQLDLRTLSPRHEMLSWSPDNARLVAPAAPPRR